MKKKGLFLDRDGVINVDHGYVHKIEDFQFIDGIFELTRLAVRKNYIICVVSNQAGIGRGYYTEADFKELTDWMCKQFRAEGVIIDNVYYSPYHPTEAIGEYRMPDYRRKPKPGMILEAACEFNLDLSKSILIGDKQTDICAGLSAGVGCNILIDDSDITNNYCGSVKVVSSLAQADQYI